MTGTAHPVLDRRLPVGGPLAAAFAGAGAGVLAKLGDESSVRWAADLGTYPAVWVAVIALVARVAPSGATAAVRAGVFFVGMCAGYYAWSSLVLGFAGTTRFLLAWAGLSVTLVPLVAATCWWAYTRPGALPGAVTAVVAVLALVDNAVWQVWWAYVLDAAPEGFPLRPVQAVLDVVVVLLVAVLPRAALTRLWALLLLLPAAGLVRAVLVPLAARFVPL